MYNYTLKLLLDIPMRLFVPCNFLVVNEYVQQCMSYSYND